MKSKTFYEVVSTNIVLSAKSKGIKICDLESACDVSVGYFSRKKGMRAVTLWKASRELGVSMDDLCDAEYGNRIAVLALEKVIAEKENEIREAREALERLRHEAD